MNSGVLSGIRHSFLKLPVEKGQHALREQPALAGVEVELVLVADRRPVGIGIEERLGFHPLLAEFFGQQLGVRPERVRVSHRDQRRGKRWRAYYFMWWAGHPAAEQCEGCTWVTAQVTELSYLHSRDITYAVFCQGPYDESIRYHVRHR
jgi:Bacterial protein of unknown function (DUF899)